MLLKDQKRCANVDQSGNITTSPGLADFGAGDDWGRKLVVAHNPRPFVGTGMAQRSLLLFYYSSKLWPAHGSLLNRFKKTLQLLFDYLHTDRHIAMQVAMEERCNADAIICAFNLP